MNFRNPIREPASAAHKISTKEFGGLKLIKNETAIAFKEMLLARPSSPSIRLNAFIVPIIKKASNIIPGIKGSSKPNIRIELNLG